MLALESLYKKYNVGIKLEEDGRFYNGNNRNTMYEKAKVSGYRNYYSYYAKELKRILKEEFGVNISARSPHWGSIWATLTITSEELFKPYDELTEKEKLDLIGILWNNFHGKDYTWEDAKNYYEKVYTQTGSQSVSFDVIGMKDLYKNMFKFADHLLDSWNYDHTGSFMGDCDYCDADFYGFVGYSIKDSHYDYKLHESLYFKNK